MKKNPDVLILFYVILNCGLVVGTDPSKNTHVNCLWCSLNRWFHFHGFSFVASCVKLITPIRACHERTLNGLYSLKEAYVHLDDEKET